jgi:alkylated DNA repair dioxygenase AlkB
MLSQPDLFGETAGPAVVLPSGLSLSPALIDGAEERALISHIDASGLEPFRFGQWLGKRLTHSFGWHYDFTGGGLIRGDPMPHWLIPLRMAMAGSFGADAAAYEQALVIRYDAGAGIGWHRDRPQFGEVMGISLGSAVDMRLRRRIAGGFDRHKIALIPRHAYHLSGDARFMWEHSILPVEAPRWSVTFRSLARDGSAQRR